MLISSEYNETVRNFNIQPTHNIKKNIKKTKGKRNRKTTMAKRVNWKKIKARKKEGDKVNF